MSRTRRLWRVVATLMTLMLLMSVATPTLAKRKPNPNKPPIDIQILGLNDFHGMLEAVPATSTSGARIGNLTGGACVAPVCVPAGGVEYLATTVRNLRAENPNTVFVSAGDLIGATPLLSALFHDEPTIEAFNLMDLDYNGVGNHEFDEGITELLRMQYGNEPGFRYTPVTPDGCHPLDECGDGDHSLAPTSTSSPPTSCTGTPAIPSSRPTPSTPSRAATRSPSWA